MPEQPRHQETHTNSVSRGLPHYEVGPDRRSRQATDATYLSASGVDKPCHDRPDRPDRRPTLGALFVLAKPRY
jgi:hypothetical protein